MAAAARSVSSHAVFATSIRAGRASEQERSLASAGSANGGATPVAASTSGSEGTATTSASDASLPRTHVVSEVHIISGPQ